MQKKTKDLNQISEIINQVARECGLHLIGEGDRIKYFLNKVKSLVTEVNVPE